MDTRGPCSLSLSLRALGTRPALRSFWGSRPGQAGRAMRRCGGPACQGGVQRSKGMGNRSLPAQGQAQGDRGGLAPCVVPLPAGPWRSGPPCLSVLLDEPMGPRHTGVCSGLSSALPPRVAWALFPEARCPRLQHAGTTQQARELGANETLAPRPCYEGGQHVTPVPAQSLPLPSLLGDPGPFLPGPRSRGPLHPGAARPLTTVCGIGGGGWGTEAASFPGPNAVSSLTSSTTQFLQEPWQTRGAAARVSVCSLPMLGPGGGAGPSRWATRWAVGLCWVLWQDRTHQAPGLGDQVPRGGSAGPHHG